MKAWNTMIAPFPKQRTTGKLSLILAISAFLGLSAACFGWQGTTTKPAEKPATKTPAIRTTSGGNVTAPQTAPKAAPKTSTTEKPVTKKAVPEKPAAEKVTTAKPATEKTGTVKPVTQKPADQKPAGKPTASAGSSIEKLHPANPVFLYVWDGYGNHAQTFEATAFYRSFISTGIGKSAEKLVNLVFRDAPTAIGSYWEKGFIRGLTDGASLSVAIEAGTDGPAVHVTLVLHGAADFSNVLDEQFAGPLQDANPQTETLSDRKVTRVAIPNLEGYEMGWWVEGEHFVLAGGLQGIDAAIQVATAKTANLSTNATYQKLRKSPDFDVVSVQIVDFPTILKLVRDLDVPPIPGSSKPPIKVDELLKIVGVDQLGLLKGRWGFRGEAIWTETDLDVPAPLTGLMALYDQKPLSLQDLPPLPPSCEYFMLTRHDISKSYATARKIAESIAEKIAPDGAPSVADSLVIMNDHLGIDLQADFVEPLGDIWTLYVESSGFVPAGVFLMKLDDSKKVQDALVKLEDLVKGSSDLGAFELRAKVSLGRTIHYAQFKELPFISPTWVVDKDWLVIGTTPQAIEGYLKRLDGKLPRWKPTPETQVAQKMLSEKFTTFYFADPRGALKYGLGLAPTGIAMLEEQFNASMRRRQADFGEKPKKVEFPVTPEDIPITEEVTGPLFPNIGACTVDATGIHWRNRNSLPGLPIMGIPGGTGGIEGMFFMSFSNAAALFSVRAVHVEAQQLDLPPAAIQQDQN